MPTRLRFIAALIAIAAAARAVSLQWLHPLNWDEVEYFRATDWVRQGLVPYRDFWEHHTPLQWLLFAPVSALAKSDGAGAILFMRWAQAPVWIAALWLLARWMRRTGISAIATACAILLIICSSMFMLAAVEYRIDALGSALYLAGLFLLQRDRPVGAGVVFCLAGLANIRLGPLLVVTVVVAAIRNRRAVLSWLAAAATLAVAVVGLALTGSLAVAVRRVWNENYLGDRLSTRTMPEFLHRLGVPFGFAGRGFEPAAFDLATVVIIVAGVVGLVRALLRRRDDLFFLALLQLGSLAFIVAMKFVYHYHFLIVLLMLLPFVAAEIDHLGERRWRLVAAVLVAASAVNLFASLFRGKERDLAYQDFVMRQINARADGKVFDGVGWATRRPSAYRYWFLPTLVFSLEGTVFEPYTAAAMTSDPPAAIVTDYRAVTWLQQHRDVSAYAVRHYLPEWRNMWLPGMSARLRAGQSFTFIVPASGTYRVVASPALVPHLWFGHELMAGSFPTRMPIGLDLARFGPPQGVDLPPRIELRRGQRLTVTAAEDAGLFIVPIATTRLFQQPPWGVTLDAALPPVTHVPFR